MPKISNIQVMEDSGCMAFADSLSSLFGVTRRRFAKVNDPTTSECLSYPNFQFGKTASRVDLVIRIHPTWFQTVPLVSAKADWLTPGMDWHINSNYTLCWDIDERWRDRCRLTFNILDPWHAYHDLSVWLKSSVCHLLEENLIARQAGLNRLRESCVQFAHGDAGKMEYEKERAAFCTHLQNQLEARRNTLKATAPT
jgi:hypothetical protein